MSSLQVEQKGDCVTNVGLTLVSMTPEIVRVAYSHWPIRQQDTGCAGYKCTKSPNSDDKIKD